MSSTPAEILARTQKDLTGLTAYAAITGLTTGDSVINALIAIVEPQATQTDRGHLDQMSRAAQLQLLKELYTIKTFITAWHV